MCRLVPGGAPPRAAVALPRCDLPPQAHGLFVWTPSAPSDHDAESRGQPESSRPTLVAAVLPWTTLRSAVSAAATHTEQCSSTSMPGPPVARMTLRPGTEDGPVHVLQNRQVRILRLAPLVDSFRRITRSRPSEQPPKPARESDFATPGLQLRLSVRRGSSRRRSGDGQLMVASVSASSRVVLGAGARRAARSCSTALASLARSA